MFYRIKFNEIVNNIAYFINYIGICIGVIVLFIPVLQFYITRTINIIITGIPGYSSIPSFQFTIKINLKKISYL